MSKPGSSRPVCQCGAVLPPTPLLPFLPPLQDEDAPLNVHEAFIRLERATVNVFAALSQFQVALRDARNHLPLPPGAPEAQLSFETTR